MNILITGAAQGIGKSIAKYLASEGNVLILVDLQQDTLSLTANELRPLSKEVIEMTGDLADKNFLNTLKSYIANNQIDVLINNAGIAPSLKFFQEFTPSELELSLKVNLEAPFELIQAAIPGMKDRGQGTILNIASRSNIYGYYKMAVYAATKAAVTSLNGTVALENPEIRSITIIPGRTNTPMQAALRGVNEASKAQSPDYVGGIISKIVKEEIDVKSGDAVIIDFESYKIVSELDRNDLHKNMH